MDIFKEQLIRETIEMNFLNVGNDIEQYFISYFKKNIEGKCHNEGYIEVDNVSIVNYSSGLLEGDKIIYNVVYSCNVCIPYEGMIIECIVKNLNKVGIRAIVREQNNPINIFLTRENNPNIDDYNEGDIIKIKVLGHRYEINDKFISVIGEII
tara:strand:+ start:354 stop:812 length:459 start_codon:yes stop_codon:yes gene_type:complete